MIAIYRDIIRHYDGAPERQEQEFNELVAMLKKAIMPP
jgi:hypothetical protein